MKRIYLFLLLITLGSCGIIGGKKYDTIKENQYTNPAWKTLTMPNFSIQYPPEWELNQSGKANTVFILLSPLESDSDTYHENISLVLEDLKGKHVSLNQYASAAELQIKKAVSEAKLLENKNVLAGTLEYHRQIFTGVSDTLHMKFEQNYHIHDGQVYVFTMACKSNTFKKYEEIGENILNSIVFKK